MHAALIPPRRLRLGLAQCGVDKAEYQQRSEPERYTPKDIHRRDGHCRPPRFGSVAEPGNVRPPPKQSPHRTRCRTSVPRPRRPQYCDPPAQMAGGEGDCEIAMMRVRKRESNRLAISAIPLSDTSPRPTPAPARRNQRADVWCGRAAHRTKRERAQRRACRRARAPRCDHNMPVEAPPTIEPIV